MKQVDKFLLLFAVFFALNSEHGFNYGLPIVLICFGVKECFYSAAYLKKGQRNRAILSFVFGLLLFCCSFLSISNLI